MLAASRQPNGHQQQQQSGSLPTKHVTLSTSMRSSQLNQSTRTDQTLNLSQRSAHQQSTKLNSTLNTNSNSNATPIPAQMLHPNHITDVFPDALTALNKTDEHTYSSSINPAAHADHNGHHQQQQPSIHHAHSHTSQQAHSHHKIPLRMPIGPNVSQAYHPNGGSGAAGGSLFDGATNVSGMEDSYIHGQPPSATPHLQSALSTDRVLPLQRENLRLVRSNNSLQSHLVAEGERIEQCEETWAKEMRQVKTKHADLQFLHAQKTRKIAQQEQKIHELQTRLEQVLSDRQAYVKESIEAPARLTAAPIQPAATFRASATVHPSEVDQLRAHEQRIASLQCDLDAHQKATAEWEREKAVLERKVQTRDEEVKRLSEVLESERNWDKMHVEFELKKHIKTIAKLEQQVDFLNDQRQAWEKDVKSFQEMGVSASYMQQLHVAQQQTAHVEGEYHQAVQRIHQLQRQVEEQSQQMDRMEQAKQGIDVHAQEKLDEREQQLAELQRKVSKRAHPTRCRCGVTIRFAPLTSG